MVAIDAIAEALARVRVQVDKQHAQIIHSNDLARGDRETLIATGWLQEIMRGWYMLVRPDIATGDTAAWYANFWDFVRIYLNHRFGEAYCLSAESSLDLHTDNPTIPKQVIVIVKQGSGLRKLMHDTSLLMYTDVKNFPSEITQKQGINIFSLPYALCKAAPTYFQKTPRDAELALRTIKMPAELSRVIIQYNLKAAGARIVGAYLFLQDEKTASAIKNDLKMAGLLVNPNNPFQQQAPLLHTKVKSPYAGRIQSMWAEARETVIQYFPKPPGLPVDTQDYLHHIDGIYQYDAYNSLSIEGYQVTYELIEKVKNNQWDPVRNEYDNNIKNAMAAKGYFDAFQQVKACVAQIIQGENAASIVQENIQIWYQNLFGPSARAGIIKPESLFGYRNDRVFIRNSRHIPPPKEVLIDAMSAFFECLEHEPHSAVRAILGHYFFVYIHPYMDGNGRIARFLMNALFASGGYSWTVVRVANRNQYITTLENTHTEFNMAAFTQFIKGEMEAVEYNNPYPKF